MKLKTLLVYGLLGLGLLAVFLVLFFCSSEKGSERTAMTDSEKLTIRYAAYLDNHPFRASMNLSREERKAKGIPPNKFYEQEWLYSSDPVLLRPAPEKLHALQKKLLGNTPLKAPPGDPSNSWVERGPDNVGGRTHTMMFAPGSTIKVFAGSVSGGLWVNNNITSGASQWQRVNGVPSNMSVMCMTVDPNDPNIMYIGTGEVYTWGAVNGNGIYKSTDGGDNWTNIYSGGTTAEDKLTYVQDIIAWNNPTTNLTEIYFGADAMAYTEEVESGSAGAGWNWLGDNTIGLYKSTDGTNFSRLTGSLYESSAGNYYAPNDFEIGADGTLWMGTKYSYSTGEGGGVVFNNTGTGWQFVRDLGDNGRVELACSKQTANKIYALCEDRTSSTNPVKIYRTTSGFSTAPTSLSQPNDADTGISANDFTRGQSFYDLMIGIDPNNDATLYVGGIDLFKSTNSGNNWSQFSHWYGGFGYQEVHADQHGIAFANSNRIVFGNDGGIFYTNNGGTTTSPRNNGYNVTQFYKAAINQPTSTDKLLAGAQDNGSQLIDPAPGGVGSSTEVTGGDGCWAFIDQDSQYMISSYIYNNFRYITYGGSFVGNFPNSDNNGDFVNQCGLDSATNILLSNATIDNTSPTPDTYQIYRWAINPSGPSITRSTLSNAMLNTVPTYFVASPYTSNRFLIGTALGKIIRMNNTSGTPTWTDISMPGQVGAVSDIRYGASENEILVTFHNYGVTSIWYTSNGASGSPTWVSKEGNLPDLPVKCILKNPLNNEEVIIGTELGVWKTSDWSSVSPTWVQSQNGMSDVKVLSFDFRSADNTILASTFGRGMFTGTFETATCPGTTTFISGSWNNGSPSTTKAAIIYQDYDTAVNGSIDACTLRITEGQTVTVRAGDYLKIEGDINIDGTLIIEHEGSVVQTDANALVTNSGTINVLLDTPNLASRDFMILGSPMTGETRGSVWSSAFLVLDHNTLNFVPHPDVEIQFPGAENFADDNNDAWAAYGSGGSVDPGRGYLVRPQAGYGQPGGIFNYTYDDGTLNTGDVTFSVIYNTPGPTAADNKNASPNVLANPYPSSIYANDFINANAMIDEVFFWEHLTPPNTGLPGAGSMNFSMEDISMYNLSGGVGAGNPEVIATRPNGYISTGQGFGIKATASGTATFTNAMRRTTNNNTLRAENDKDRLWLNVENAQYEMGGSTLIAFNENATSGIDSGYDSRRLATVVSLYSHLEDGSRQLGIQTREAFESGMKVPVGFSSQLEANLEYKISISTLEGDKLEGATVYLIDNYTNTVTNLSEGAYVFSSNKGTFHNRFTLQFEGEDVLGSDDITLSELSIFPNPTNGSLHIVSLMDPITHITVFDINGRKLAEMSYASLKTAQVGLSAYDSAMYFLKVTTESGREQTKRVVKR